MIILMENQAILLYFIKRVLVLLVETELIVEHMSIESAGALDLILTIAPSLLLPWFSFSPSFLSPLFSFSFYSPSLKVKDDMKALDWSLSCIQSQGLL